MKSSTILSVLALGAAQVVAAPVQDAPALVPRQGEDFIWTNEDGNGNSQVSIGDGKMNFGHLVPSSTLEAIDKECTSTGCKPNEDIKVKALIVDSDIGTEHDITLQVEGSFNAAGDRGSKRQLLDLAKQALEKLYDNGIAERKEGVIYKEKSCPPFNPMCPNPAKYTDQWKSTNHVSVRVDNDNDGGLAGFLNIGWKPPADAEPGICGAFTAAGVGLGLANAFAGAGLVLAGVACNEI